MVSVPVSDAWRAVHDDIAALMRDAALARSQLRDESGKGVREQRRLLLAMLDVLDGFERVFANVGPKEAAADRQARIWVGNFRSVCRVLEGHLRELGVVRIEAPAGRVVAGFHTVAETRERLDLDDETILEELQHGYLWRGEVLRKATVVAVRN